MLVSCKILADTSPAVARTKGAFHPCVRIYCPVIFHGPWSHPHLRRFSFWDGLRRGNPVFSLPCRSISLWSDLCSSFVVDLLISILVVAMRKVHRLLQNKHTIQRTANLAKPRQNSEPNVSQTSRMHRGLCRGQSVEWVEGKRGVVCAGWKQAS